MSAAPNAAEPAPDPDLNADQYAADARLYRRLLHKMLEIGEALLDELTERTTEASVAAKAEAYERLTRAMRRCIVLAEHVASTAQSGPSQQRIVARQRIVRHVEDVIHLAAPRPTDAEPLRAELLERLDGPDIDAAILTRPLAEIIEDLLRDLGIAAYFTERRPWKRRTPADIHALCAIAAQAAARPKTAATRPKLPPAIADPPLRATG